MNEQQKADRLADMIWFIKGWRMSDDCPFDAGHLEVLREAQCNFLSVGEQLEQGQIEQLKNFAGDLAAELGLFDENTGELSKEEKHAKHVQKFRELIEGTG